MYWLLTKSEQRRIRRLTSRVVHGLSTIVKPVQVDQLFPYLGRKDRRKARVIVRTLSSRGDRVCDAFAGSGVFTYAIAETRRKPLSNEYEPYAHRLGNAPWRIPERKRLRRLLGAFCQSVNAQMCFLYRTVCVCGHVHVLDSLFFDREPLRYTNVTRHNRLGRPNGENITYRGSFACPNCGAKEKHFDSTDAAHLRKIRRLRVSSRFSAELIENSRINLRPPFTKYRNLFPYRSMLALDHFWKEIQALRCTHTERLFFEDIFLSIIPQAKYKDYRSKSQDLHPPRIQLREVNLFYRFQQQFEVRISGLSQYTFSASGSSRSVPIACKDFRDFMRQIQRESVDLILNDPPWGEANPYFEKAQLYHPWMNYSLKKDKKRLSKEVIVTNAPSRPDKHSYEAWWSDIGELFKLSHRVLKPMHFMALFFRPAPARYWLRNLNRVKLLARQSGFEPIRNIDVHSKDPSMRVQQSASYIFDGDVVMLFLKLPDPHRRFFIGDIDVDQLVYQSAVALQEEDKGPFSLPRWRTFFRKWAFENDFPIVNRPSYASQIHTLFKRYCDEVARGQYLPKALTPFSDQLFDVLAVERLSTYVPVVIDQLTQGGRTFSYAEFLLGISEYVENGTRELIKQIQRLNIEELIEIYAEPTDQAGHFRKRPLPTLPHGITKVIKLDHTQFERFVARLFRAQGYTQIGVVGRTGDRGVDIWCKDPDGSLTVIQCKRYLVSNVGAAPIQRLDSYARTRGASRRMLVTTSDFTRDAKDEARITDTQLINGRALEALIATHMPEWS